MNFLEARKILDTFSGEESVTFQLSASGNVDPLLLYIRAVAAKQGLAADVSTLPFGTLAQSIYSHARPDAGEVLLLLPWDLVPETDWRSGIPSDSDDLETLLDSAARTAEHIRARHAAIVYIPAPIPPVWPDTTKNRLLQGGIHRLALELGASILQESCFSMGNYLSSGSPVAGSCCGEVAAQIVAAYNVTNHESCKVLITDLDNVMWSGLAAEEGVEGILCGPEGKGYRHFLYQGFIHMLKNSGVVLAAVSRNDPDVARAPIIAGRTLLSEDDFLEILASYEPKSLQIRRLAESLNLGLDSFVFVDDNPIELAEVSASLPAVYCLQFPSSDDELPDLFAELTRLFAREHVSEEDRERTTMYRRKLAVNSLSEEMGEGGDISGFLKELGMTLSISDRTAGGHERALQLINKTNQFNLNGRRLSDDEFEKMLSRGGKLYTADLEDRTGNHGEILSCLINDSSEVVSLVMSCRVFQRHIEHVFLCWLGDRVSDKVFMHYQETEKNTPLRQFVEDESFNRDGNLLVLDMKKFSELHGEKVALFKQVKFLD